MNVTESFRAFADCLREPAMLVSTAGDVLALNTAAANLFGINAATATMTFRIADFLHGGGAALDDFIRAASRTRQPIFASLQLRTPSGAEQVYRAEGVLYHPATRDVAATVFLRLMPRESANAPMVALDERLRAFGRSHAGTPRFLTVNDVVSITSDMLRPLMGENVEVVTRLAPNAPLVFLEPAQLERVLVNLAIHARDAMHGHGRLTIETGERVVAAHQAAERFARYATVSVRDTGPALTREEQASIFEPNSALLSRPQGAGISLASCYATVTELGGRIEVDDRSRTGTTFVVLLPVVDSAVPTPPDVSSESMTILVVDDDDNVRDLIADSLQSARFSVLSASDGASALEIARSHSEGIDLLITDVVMPGLTGPRVAQVLRAENPRLRVLYVSGYTDRVDLPRDPSGSEAAFLGKPFTRGTLLGRVKALLET